MLAGDGPSCCPWGCLIRVLLRITNDLERREAEHRDEGKRFSTIKAEGPRVTRPTAENWEEQRLAGYRSTHRGRNPRYNDTDK
jgi:hypothetical protein